MDACHLKKIRPPLPVPWSRSLSNTCGPLLREAPLLVRAHCLHRLHLPLPSPPLARLRPRRPDSTDSCCIFYTLLDPCFPSLPPRGSRSFVCGRHPTPLPSPPVSTLTLSILPYPRLVSTTPHSLVLFPLTHPHSPFSEYQRILSFLLSGIKWSALSKVHCQRL